MSEAKGQISEVHMIISAALEEFDSRKRIEKVRNDSDSDPNFCSALSSIVCAELFLSRVGLEAASRKV